MIVLVNGPPVASKRRVCQIASWISTPCACKAAARSVLLAALFAACSTRDAGTSDSATPPDVEGPRLLDRVTQLVAGKNPCALRADGSVWCWGDATDGGHPSGRPAHGFEDVTFVGRGSQHKCVLHVDRGVSCWGYNLHGELGRGSDQGGNEPPARVLGIDDAQSLHMAAGGSCVVRPGGEAWCWGGLTQHYAPVRIEPLPAVEDVAISSPHACAVSDTGQLHCWGRNLMSTFGDPDIADTDTPVPVPSITGVKEVFAGHQHTCALFADGAARCWGYRFGERPTDIGVESVVQIAPGFLHNCALDASGQVWCWGSNDKGQLGDGTTDDRSAPVQVVGIEDATFVDVHERTSCAVVANGHVRCWGDNHKRQLGDGGDEEFSALPVDVLLDP